MGGAYADIVGDVARVSGKSPSDYLADRSIHYSGLHNPFAVKGDAQALYNADAIWADVAAARQRDPKAFAGLARDRGEFEQQILERNGAAAQDAATTAKGSAVAGFVGGLGAGFTDPVNLVFGGAGGKLTGVGKTFAQRMLLEGVVNAGIEAAQTPANIEARARLGEKTNTADVAKDIGMAFGAGMAMHASVASLEHVGSWAYNKAPLDWRAARALNGADPLTASPSQLADAFSAKVPEYLRTPDEQAALHVVRRASEIEAANPYENTYAGQDLHQQRLEIAADRLLTGTSRGVVGWADARSLFKAKLRHAESGGNDLATNPRSSAAGRYQFTDGTWLRMYKDRFGDAGTSKADILAKKLDTAAQESVMDHALTRYEKAVRDAGQPVTAANLYLEHFAGEGGARRLFDADGAAMAGDVLGAKVVKANPWMRGMSVDDLKAWSARKMGGDTAEMRMGDTGEAQAGSDIEAAMARRDADMAADELDAAMGRTAPEDIAGAARGDMPVGEPIMPLDAPAMQEMPRLQLELFPDEKAHRAAQVMADAHALGVIPDGDTRGGGVQYHGARGEVPKLSEGYYNGSNIYGGHDTFYTTDAIDIAKGYGRKKQSAKIYRVDEVQPVRHFDMEERLSPEDIAKIFGVADLSKEDGFVASAIIEATGPDGRINLREAMDSMRSLSKEEGLSVDDVQEYFDAAIYNLQNSDFGGMTHLGGLQTASEPHTVKIYFRPHEQLHLSELTANKPDLLPIEDAPQSLRYRDMADRQAAQNSYDLAQPAADVGAEPTGPAAQLQADGLAHDVRADLDAGKLDGLNFAVEGAAEPVSAKMALTRMEADKAALDALKDCM